MIKAKALVKDTTVTPTSATVKRLIIKNIRCIGSAPVEIDLDDVVVPVAPHNTGKRTILTSQGAGDDAR